MLHHRSHGSAGRRTGDARGSSDFAAAVMSAFSFEPNNTTDLTEGIFVRCTRWKDGNPNRLHRYGKLVEHDEGISWQFVEKTEIDLRNMADSDPKKKAAAPKKSKTEERVERLRKFFENRPEAVTVSHMVNDTGIAERALRQALGEMVNNDELEVLIDKEKVKRYRNGATIPF